MDLLSSGMNEDEILADYPSLEKEDILASLEYASHLVKVKSIYKASAWSSWSTLKLPFTLVKLFFCFSSSNNSYLRCWRNSPRTNGWNWQTKDWSFTRTGSHKRRISASWRPGLFETGFLFFVYPFLIFRFLENRSFLLERISTYRRVLSVDKKENFRSTFRTNFKDWTRSLFRSSLIPLWRPFAHIRFEKSPEDFFSGSGFSWLFLVILLPNRKCFFPEEISRLRRSVRERFFSRVISEITARTLLKFFF